MVLVVEATIELRVGDILRWSRAGTDIDLRVDAIDLWQKSVEALPKRHKGGVTLTGGDISLIPRGEGLRKV